MRAEAADDDVARKPVDVFLHAADPEELVELAGRDELHEAARDEDHIHAAGDDQAHGDGAQRRRLDRQDLPVADREDRDDHHVDRVADRPALQRVGEGRDRTDQQQDIAKAAGCEAARRGRQAFRRIVALAPGVP